MEKIENVMFPQKGTKYLVLCARLKRKNYSDPSLTIPVIPHLHNDKENLQPEAHYHVDDRFDYKGMNKHLRTRISEDIILETFYQPLPLCRYNMGTPTSVNLIRRSKLKHNCIYKGKCPHRGYDLTNTPEKNGVITCPLHSLQFDAQTKIIISNPF